MNPTKNRLATYEIHSNCRNVRFSVSIIRKSQQETRFTNAGISNEEEFEKVVAARIWRKNSNDRKEQDGRGGSQRKERMG